MPTVYEIKNISKKIYNASQEIRRKKNNMNGEIAGIKSWWLGAASDSFVENYMNIDGDIGKIISNLDDLQNEVNNLSKVLERVEMERKLAAASARK